MEIPSGLNYEKYLRNRSNVQRKVYRFDNIHFGVSLKNSCEKPWALRGSVQTIDLKSFDYLKSSIIKNLRVRGS